MNDKKRLLDITSLVDPGKSVIDIGTDHGLVPLYLAKNNISTDILATDISAPSLKKLEDKLDDELSKVIKTKVTDGFIGLEEKPNQIAIIAGMGGNTIIDIIADRLDFAKGLDYLILASNIATERLRSFLINEGFYIERDFLTFENNKYYDIIKAIPGRKSTLNLGEIYYGHENVANKSELLKEKLAIDLEKNQQFRADIVKNSTDKAGLAKIDERLAAINEVYERWK